MNNQFCMCGVQPGYQHKIDCPFPAYNAGPEQQNKWMVDRNKMTAAVIAAAPEMLEVLQTIQSAFVESYGDFKYSDWEHIVQNVLNKAEGR